MRLIILAFLLTSLISWAKIQSAKFSATDLGNNWYEHEKFGVFFDAHQSGWYFHLDQGWIYVDEWNDEGSWIYKPLDDSNDSAFPLSEKVALGWMWSNAKQYPQLYNHELKDWLYFEKDRNESKYYHHKRKKYLAENFILKSTVDSEDWKSLAPLFEDLSDYNESEHELLDLDTFYPDKWSISIPKADLANDSNWSALIYSLIDNPSEADKRGIENILETEDSVLVNWGAVATLIITAKSPGIEIIIDLEEDQSTFVEDLEAQAEFIAGTAEAVASGEIKLISKNNYELELVKVDSKLMVLNKLKAKYPEYTEKIENYKEFASEINGLLESIDSKERRYDVFKDGVLEIFANEENQAIINNLTDYVSLEQIRDFLLDDPVSFSKVVEILKSDSSVSFEQAKFTADQESNWDEQYEEWIKNPEPYGGLTTLQKIKEAKDSGATELELGAVPPEYATIYISDVTPLSELTNLKKLSLFNTYNVQNIEPLSTLVNLTELTLTSNSISDITPIEKLKNLEFLYMQECDLNDDHLSSLSKLPKLIKLNLRENEILDPSPLAEFPSLKILAFGGSGSDKDQAALPGLAKLSNLEELDLSYFSWGSSADSQKLALEEALPNTTIIY